MSKFYKKIAIDGKYDYDHESLKENWNRLHACENEPFPSADYLRQLIDNNAAVKSSIPEFSGDYHQLSSQLLDGWRLFHRGDFEEAFLAGRKLGYPGYLISHMASCVYAANVPESKDTLKEIYQESAQKSLEASKAMPAHVNSTYFYGLHLGRYSETVSLIKAAAENIAPKFSNALSETLKHDTNHVLANIGFGTFHASVVDTIGAMMAKITYGASKEKAYQYFEHGMKVAPHLAVVYIEYGKGLAMMEGKKGKDKAKALYEKGAKLPVVDAMEELDMKICAQGLE